MHRRRPPPHAKITRVPLTADIATRFKQVPLMMDILFVNGIPFLHTKTGHLDYLTIKLLPNRSATSIINAVEPTINLHEARGFSISDIHADGEFDIDSVHDNLLPARLQIYAKNEHVAIVERSIQTTKKDADVCAIPCMYVQPCLYVCMYV